MLAEVLLAVAFLAQVAMSPPLAFQAMEELIRAAADACDALPLDTLIAQASVPDLKVVEYTRDGHRSYQLAKAHTILRNRLPDELIIYISGWLNTPTDESSQTLTKALLKKSPLVLVIDLQTSFETEYVLSAIRVKGVSQSIFKFIHNLHVNNTYDVSKIHLLAFSLGGHVAGITGKLVQSKLGNKIGRITALDPPRSCFIRPSKYRLDKRDAQFVHVVHTSAGLVGLEEPVGHADVYVNEVLEPQPECKGQSFKLRCGHMLSWRLFSASVTNEGSLMARKCKDWSDLLNERCNGDEAVLGYGCSAATRGVYLHVTEKVTNNFEASTPSGWLLQLLR